MLKVRLFVHYYLYHFLTFVSAVRTLHVKHRIVGCLVGSLPTSKNEQNIAHGLPLLLSPEEVAVGTKHGN